LSSIATIAGLTWKRMLRGRTLWVSLLLLLVPILVALLAVARVEDPRERWAAVCMLTLRSLVMLAPIVHLATVVSEENDGKTYTYLWSRPVPRHALVLGKMLAVVPVLMVAAVVALTIAFAIISAGPGETDPSWLPRALGASAAGVVGASCFAVGVGALVPRHPLVVALGWVLVAEQVLSAVPAIQNLSTLFHAIVIADMPGVRFRFGEPIPPYLAMAVLSAVWLGIALWRVRRLEFGSAEG
jgi:hypothetical protein